jgi:ATP-dependent DNA helicase RecQ
MINTGLLDVSGAQYPVLKLNAMSRKILKGTERIELVCPEGFTPEAAENLALSIAAGINDKKTNDLCFSPEEPFSDKFSVAADILKTSDKKVIKSGKEPDPILFERLRALRKEIALTKNLPPYIIFSDTTLKEMAARFPRSPEKFHSITGVGEHKLRKYGKVFLKEIENYCRDYSLVPTVKPDKSELSCKDSEIEEITSKEIDLNDENPEAEIKILGTKMSNPASNNLNSLEACNLSTKEARYLDTSIQDWSERKSSTGSIREIDLAGIPPESGAANAIKADTFESGSFETDCLQRTYSLFTKGLGIDEIAEIQGTSTGNVFRQLEQLAFSGAVRSTGGLFPPERQQQIKASLEALEIELDSLLRARLGEKCQEEEIKFVRALLLSRIFYSQPEDNE